MRDKHDGELFPPLLYESLVGVKQDSLQEEQVILQFLEKTLFYLFIFRHTPPRIRFWN